MITLSVVSCSSSDEFKLTLDQLCGEWVYDHPELGVWETMKFLPSGVFYYSNKVSGEWNFSNDNNGGRYWIDEGRRVTAECMMEGVQATIMIDIKEITAASFTAEFYNGGLLGSFTYAKLLGSVQVEPGETTRLSPSGFNVLGFRSHDEDILTVDSTGKITGISSGRSYVDVETDLGTAVYEVIVFDKDNMFKDYSYAFGKTIEEIVAVEGDDYLYRDDRQGLIYLTKDYIADTVLFITGMYDYMHVEFVQLKLNKNVSVYQIKTNLDGKYELLTYGENKYYYLLEGMVNGKPEVLMLDTENLSVTFALISPSGLWKDYTYLFGKTKDVVKSEMDYWKYMFVLDDYSYSADGSSYFLLNDSEYANMAGFVFNSENRMCEYWIYLNDDFMSHASEILDWLKSAYTMESSECTSSQYVFYDSDKRLKVVFSATGYVSYTDSLQKPFTPAS